jgi:hypothetical protein
MDQQAHGLDLNHAIFNTPNKVTFTWHEQPREKQYLADATSVLYPHGMGETMRLCDFEIDKPADDWNPILVNHEGFFTDVPGLENLAEGHSGKCLGSVSLVRQGRWFYWGYSIDPARMTAPAKDTLVNVLHYMRGKRDSVTVPFVCVTRQILTVYLDLNKESGYLRGIQEHMPGQLTEEWQQDYTDRTPEGYQKWLDRYLPYVFSGKGPQHENKRYKQSYEVDRDAMALHTPNKERGSLERWLALAAAVEGDPGTEDRAAAVRCLQRYVHPDIAPKDGNWTAWYAKYRDRIVFIESTGFWWQEDPRLLEKEQAALQAT